MLDDSGRALVRFLTVKPDSKGEGLQDQQSFSKETSGAGSDAFQVRLAYPLRLLFGCGYPNAFNQNVGCEGWRVNLPPPNPMPLI
jgi:hypothetical protein